MSRTITAFFDSRSEAESARQRLTRSIDAEDVRIVDKSSGSSTSESPGGSSSSSSGSGGFWSSVKEAFMPSEDRFAYEEGMRRGGYLLCARVDEDRADEACRLLEETGSVDFDKRQDEWRSEGWQGYQGPTSGGFARSEERKGTVEEERIPLVEEELRVGKREVERGGARVRSYVEEVPVSEQVSLREENVEVERRPVDRQLSPEELERAGLLQEREVEMTERSEQPVVEKQARVTEEVVLRKTANERTEQIDDTVRRTEVDVDDTTGSGRDAARPAFGFSEGERSEAGERRTNGAQEPSRERETFDGDSRR